MKKTRSKFSADLKKWRGRRSQPAAANLLDVPTATYRNWEQERNVPPPLVQSSIFAAMKRIEPTHED